MIKEDKKQGKFEIRKERIQAILDKMGKRRRNRKKRKTKKQRGIREKTEKVSHNVSSQRVRGSRAGWGGGLRKRGGK